MGYSPNLNESTFERNDNSTKKTYVGNRFNATAGYNFGLMSLLGSYVYSDSEYKSDSSQKRKDNNIGLTLRFNPIRFFFLQGTYSITATELTYSDRDAEEFEGNKTTVGAGIRIPTPAGPDFTVTGDYILNSRMRRKGGNDANVIDEEGYNISVGGNLVFSY